MRVIDDDVMRVIDDDVMRVIDDDVMRVIDDDVGAGTFPSMNNVGGQDCIYGPIQFGFTLVPLLKQLATVAIL